MHSRQDGTPPNDEHQQIHQWLDQLRHADQFLCSPMPLSHSRRWAIRDGSISHDTGRFFSITGLSWDEKGRRYAQPFIDQPEIGTLGFIVRRREPSNELLCYAKSEPGNVGLVQLAPTCQATRSNIERAHGGTLPPYAELFAQRSDHALSVSLQSEQGSRFLGKRNLNTVVFGDPPCHSPTHRWVSIDTFARMLAEDFRVNTDARSVICTTHWAELFGRPLFQATDDFSRRLLASYEAEVNSSRLEDLLATIHIAQTEAATARRCAVDQLEGWCFDPDHEQTLDGGWGSIIHIRVHSASREVNDWDQPIFSTHGEGRQILLCAERQGLLHFGFRLLWEPGLYNRVELAPSLSGQGHAEALAGTTHLSVAQSDEGGRFFHDVTRFSVVEIDAMIPDPDLVWLTLAELQQLLPLGHFNNEARSAVSLILSRAVSKK